MSDTKMTPEEEQEFYSRHENQEPQGPARQRGRRTADPVPRPREPTP